jgi:hypothetical protein
MAPSRRSLVRLLLAAALMVGGAATLVGPSEAEAKKDKDAGVLVRITVLDPDGNPIPTAVVRHPDEADRRRVNSVTGVWEESILYLPDGSELRFVPGMTLNFEISAPGFITFVASYDVRKRNNKLEVTLQPMEIEEEAIDEPLIQFGRDMPREVGPSAPPSN